MTTSPTISKVASQIMCRGSISATFCARSAAILCRAEGLRNAGGDSAFATGDAVDSERFTAPG